MPKRKLDDNQKERKEKELIEQLNNFPDTINDTLHGLIVVLRNDKARSNQTRFQHIIKESHDLLPRDFKTIITKLPFESKLKKDKKRKLTYNYFIKRDKSRSEYIKISVSIDKENKHIAYIKTIFITKTLK